MDINLKDDDFWHSLHGQVPGMLDWDMGNDLYLPFTTDQSSAAEQSLSKYKIRLVKAPKVLEDKKPHLDDDGPSIKPNLWMWVNPNIVCPINSPEDPNPCNKNSTDTFLSFSPLKTEEEHEDTEGQGMVDGLLVSSKKEFPQQNTSSSSDSDATEGEAGKEEKLPSPQKDIDETQLPNQQTKSWPRPPLNYSHIVALALKNSPSCGLNVQQIYNFTRQHFPFFSTAPEGWKNTIRHNLCSLNSFEKIPVTLDHELDGKPRSCLWKLTENGHRFFQEDTRALASARKKPIRDSLRQPELMDSLFDL